MASLAAMEIDLSGAEIAKSAEAASMMVETAINNPGLVRGTLHEQSDGTAHAEMVEFGEGLTRDKEGEVWRTRKFHKELGGTHSLTNIHKYIKSFKQDSLAPSESTARDVPYGSVQD